MSWHSATSRSAFARLIHDIIRAASFQTPTPQAVPTPEKLPAWLTLVYLIGIALVGLLLLLSILRAWFSRAPVAPTAPSSLPKDIQKRLGATTTNRGLRAWRWLFALAAIFVFSFHVYWARYAAADAIRNFRNSVTRICATAG